MNLRYLYPLLLLSTTFSAYGSGSVVTWGHPNGGGDSSSVASQLSSGVLEIYSTNGASTAFAARKEDGSVVTWGDSSYGGDSSSVDLSSGVSTIYSSNYAFAALIRADNDNDGVLDSDDAFPNDPNETADTDGDGVRDNSDEFPYNPNESVDSDGDGVGDNADAFPSNPSETVDSDGDGLGDNTETGYPLGSSSSVSLNLQIISGSFSWTSALIDAEARGGRLAVLDSTSKLEYFNEFLKSLNSWPNIYLGASDSENESDWKWLNGSNVLANNWGSGEPNDGDGIGEDALAVSGGILLWNDVKDDVEFSGFGYVLELPNSTSTDPYNPDTDGDGLNDGDEVNLYFTHPNDTDSDDDGLNDSAEVLSFNTDPLDSDSDDDSLLDGAEVITYSTDPNDTDSDDDQLSDSDEINTYLTNPNLSDSDSDQISDYSEINLHLTDPNDSDSDDDGLSDGTEVNTYSTNPLLEDTSGDGLKDGVVVSAGFDPTVDYSNLVNASRQGMTDLRAGSTLIEVFGNQATVQLQMEESSDLQTWEDKGDPATMTIPADTDTKFFRFKMAD